MRQTSVSTGLSIQYTTLCYVFHQIPKKQQMRQPATKGFYCVENPKQKQKASKRFGYFSAIVSWADDNHFQYIEAIERKAILCVCVRLRALVFLLSLLIIIVAAGSKNTRQYKCHSDRGTGRGSEKEKTYN